MSGTAAGAAPVTLEMRHLAGCIGSELGGVRWSEASDAQIAALRDLLHQRCVVVLPGQHFDGATLEAFGGRLGRLVHFEDYAATIKESPEVVRIASVTETTEIWHSDGSFRPEPPGYSVLAAQVLPPAGGDTMFANQYVAYETLSPGMQRMLSGLRAVHQPRHSYALDTQPSASTHPVVRRHPETGRLALYVNALSVTNFEDMTVAESAPLLAHLYAHSHRPELVYRHHWREGDVLVWDNRCALHYAVHDHGDSERVLYRVQTAGTRPE